MDDQERKTLLEVADKIIALAETYSDEKPEDDPLPCAVCGKPADVGVGTATCNNPLCWLGRRLCHTPIVIWNKLQTTLKAACADKWEDK